MRRKILAVLVIPLLLLVFYSGSVVQANADQASIQGRQVYAWVHPSLTIASPNRSGAAVIGAVVTLTVILGHPHELFLNQTWLNEQNANGHDWIPDCVAWCFNGIHYAEDPTVHVVNGGIDCIGLKVHGAAAGTTCTKSLNSTFLMVSASGGHAPLFTDNACTATVATTNGFSIISSTYTAGTPSGGSATDTLTHTWTGATGATSSLDLACASWLGTNAANTLYAMGQIGTTTVNIGDTLQTLWSFTYSSS